MIDFETVQYQIGVSLHELSQVIVVHRERHTDADRKFYHKHEKASAKYNQTLFSFLTSKT